jgi:hypothetical protein
MTERTSKRLTHRAHRSALIENGRRHAAVKGTSAELDLVPVVVRGRGESHPADTRGRLTITPLPLLPAGALGFGEPGSVLRVCAADYCYGK